MIENEKNVNEKDAIHEDHDEENNTKNPSEEESPLPTYVRLKKTTKELFNEIAKTEGQSQESVLNKLLHLYELEQSKQMAPGKKDMIEEFHNHIQRIVNSYVNLIEHNVNADNVANEKFASKLQDAEKEIIKFRNEKEAWKEKYQASERSAKEYKRQYFDAADKRNSYESAKIISEELNKELRQKTEQQEEQIKDYKEIEQKSKSLGLSLSEIVEKYVSVKNDVENLKNEKNKLMDRNDQQDKEIQNLHNEVFELQASKQQSEKMEIFYKKEFENCKAEFISERQMLQNDLKEAYNKLENEREKAEKEREKFIGLQKKINDDLEKQVKEPLENE